MNKEIINNANIIWEYFQQFNKEDNTEVIVVCCSYDLRVCDYACDLFKRSGAHTIIFSGDRGNWTRDLWSKPEAEIFKARAIENGINPINIIIEDEATNIGENISFSKKYLNIDEKVTFVSKSNTLLRIKLTLPLHINCDANFSAPKYSFPDEVSDVIGISGLINEMVGDINRIITYPSLGYQNKHHLPQEVIDSYYFLIYKGFDKHLL